MAIQISKNANLISHSTFGLDARSNYLLSYEDKSDLLDISDFVGQIHQPITALGHESNVIFCADYPGILIRNTSHSIEKIDDRRIKVSAGAKLDELVVTSIDFGLYGLEGLSGIPGTVGGAVALNAGAYGATTKAMLESIHIYNVQTREVDILTTAQLHYWHRSSIFRERRGENLLITDAIFKLRKQPAPLEHPKIPKGLAGHELRSTIIGLREHFPNPMKKRNSGSFFLNPTVPNSVADNLRSIFPDCVMRAYDAHHQQIAAGWLLEHAGLKGQTIKGFYLSQQHANMVINRNKSANGQDLVEFIRFVQDSISEKYQIHIVPEPLLIGEEFIQGRMQVPTLSNIVHSY